ncbi:hypothetical protein BPSOL_1382 [Bifidobacterium pseudolongum]|nr:hypothetical protein BPSOL_1382 [Bifidobacterium pseudolongum]
MPYVALTGSSPHMRGKRWFARRSTCRAQIIPTHAGANMP